MKLTKVNILPAASVVLLGILLAKHSETRALQQQVRNLEETAVELESCQAKQNDEKNIQLQMEVANLKTEVELKDEMNIQLQKDVENLKTEAVALEIFNASLSKEVELMDAMNAQLQRDVETLNAEDTWLGRFGFPRHLKVQKDIENLNTEAEIKDAMNVQLQRDIENLKAEARRKDDKNIQLQKDIEKLKTEALTAELANFQVDHEKIGQNVNVNVQVLMATFVFGALVAMLRRPKKQTQKVKQVHEMPWELHGRMKEQQAIATRKLQGAWRRKAARLEERKSTEYKEARLKTLWRKMLARRIQRTWRAKVPLLRHRRQRSCAKETAYDAVFAFESLSNFLTTGEIEFLQAPESKFDFTRESRYRIVAVVGLFDKGKTFLINKLFGKNLPSGKKCPTTGISFLWIEDLEMLVLDSAGVQRPVSQCDGAVQSIQDARATESFMFEMISRIADYMIFVVNDFTWFEQEYVSMLHRKYEQMLRHTELIVVHNLRDTYEPQEAKDLFDQQIKKCYKGGSSPLDELTYVAVMQEGVPPVNHVALCKEMTLAGDKYNKKNIEHLKNQLRFRHMLGRSMSLTDSLRKELERLIPTFAYVERAPEQMPSSEKTLSVLYETCKVVDKKESGLSGLSTFEMVCKDYGKVGCMRLKAISDAKVSMKTQGVINPLGEIITHDVTFEPNVNVYDRTLQDGIERVIRIECPGVQQEDIKWKAFQSGVKISIRKQKPIEETTVQAVEPIIQHHGPWERAFEFENGSGRFDDFDEENFVLADGVLTATLRKSFQCREGKVTTKNPTLLQGLQGRDPPTPSVKSSICSFDMVTNLEHREMRTGEPVMNLKT